MNTIGENIAMLRKQNGLTQEALASAIGVSAQSISKWENNTNMPDIMILPIIADVFNISIDELFGRHSSKCSGNVENAFELCCDSMLETIMSCLYRADIEESFENCLKQYKKSINTDSKTRTGIIRKHGVVYYRKDIGGILLKKPETHWHELINNLEAMNTLNLLLNHDFRIALAEIIKSKKTVFTMASLCNSCKIENTVALEEKFNKSKLFVEKPIDIDGNTVLIYELVQGQRLFLLFAILTYAIEYDKYENVYTGYYGDGSYYFA